jgi:hypothetical protein
VKGGIVAKLLAWGIALTLVALPIVGVLNGWFASDRWPVDQLAVRAEFNHVGAEQIRAARSRCSARASSRSSSTRSAPRSPRCRGSSASRRASAGRTAVDLRRATSSSRSRAGARSA